MVTKGRIVSDHTGAISKAMRAGVSGAVRATLFAIEASAKQRAPVDLGALRADIHTVVDTGALTGTVESSMDYSLFQEYGTSTQSGTPYMTPAAESQRAPFQRRVARALKGAA